MLKTCINFPLPISSSSSYLGFKQFTLSFCRGEEGRFTVYSVYLLYVSPSIKPVYLLSLPRNPLLNFHPLPQSGPSLIPVDDIFVFVRQSLTCLFEQYFRFCLQRPVFNRPFQRGVGRKERYFNFFSLLVNTGSSL